MTDHPSAEKRERSASESQPTVSNSNHNHISRVGATNYGELAATARPDDKEEIKHKVPLASVIQHCGINLSQTGRALVGLCPFHDDHDPSFSVYTVEEGYQHFKCHPCGAGGDVFDFIAALERHRGRECDFTRAMDLAWQLHQGGLREVVILPVVTRAPSEFRQELDKAQVDHIALASFLERRGLEPTGKWTVDEFQVTTRANGALGANGELTTAILAPVLGPDGMPTGIKWRPMDGSDKFKSEAGSKLSHFYGSHRTKGHPRVVICEGETDTWSAAYWLRLEPVDVLGVLGANVHPRSFDLLKGRDEVILAYDADNAGHLGMAKVGERLRELGISYRVAKLPPDMDVCEAGKYAFRDALENATEEEGPISNGVDRLPSYSIADVLAEGYQMKWLIEDWWPCGSYGQLAGPEKALKSYIAVCQALAVASGRTLFGEFPVVAPGPVLIFSGELGRGPLGRRLVHLGMLFGLTDQDIAQLPIRIIDRTAPVLSDKFRNTLRDELERTRPVLVIIDPLYSYHGAKVSGNNVHEEGELLNALSQETTEAGAALIIVNHFTKAGADYLTLASISQAGHREWCDSWVLVRHRSDPNLAEQAFSLEASVGSRHGYGDRYEIDFRLGQFDRRTLRHVGDPHVVISRQQTKSASVKDKIIGYLLANSDYPPTKSELEQKIGGNKDAFRRTLADLVASGEVARREIHRPTSDGRSRRITVLCIPTRDNGISAMADERADQPQKVPG